MKEITLNPTWRQSIIVEFPTSDAALLSNVIYKIECDNINTPIYIGVTEEPLLLRIHNHFIKRETDRGLDLTRVQENTVQRIKVTPLYHIPHSYNLLRMCEQNVIDKAARDIVANHGVVVDEFTNIMLFVDTFGDKLLNRRIDKPQLLQEYKLHAERYNFNQFACRFDECLVRA